MSLSSKVRVDTHDTSRGAAVLLDFAHVPLRGIVQCADGRWEARDDDPQLLLTLPQAQPAGVYRITARLYGDRVRSPCLYLDVGNGWAETSRFALDAEADAVQWSAVLQLPSFSGSVRFDPSDQSGIFDFGGMTLQPLTDADALIFLLDREVRRAPASAAALMHDAASIACAEGPAAVVAALLSEHNAYPSAAPTLTYSQWVQRFDTLTCAQVEMLRARVCTMPKRPLVSLVLKVTEGHEALLNDCIDTVLAQLYPDWELCLVHAHDAPCAVAIWVDGQVRRSRRIRGVGMVADANESAALAAGLASARGALVGIIADDLRLAPHALLMLVDAVQRHPDVRLVYADDDRINARGRRIDPYFKPEWDPSLFLTQDYLSPLALYQATTLRDGFADTTAVSLREIALRCTAHGDRSEIVHVPHVLSHAVDAAVSPIERNAARADDAQRVLVEYLAQTSPGATVARDTDALRVRHALPTNAPKVSIIIPTRDNVELLRRCVDSVLALSTYQNFEVVVVDNQSSEPDTLEYFEAMQRDSRSRVLHFDAPFNYSAVNNFAVSQVDGELIALLNNDVEVITPDWLEEMLQYALRPDVGAVGAMLYYPDDTIQHAGVVVGLGGVAGHMHMHDARGTAGYCGRARHVQSLSAVTAACLLVRREAYLGVGGLDETLAIAFNDVDFCLRLMASGLRNIWTPFAELYHHESASRGSEDTPEKQARFAREVQVMLERWGRGLTTDPAYHPNLSLAYGSAFALADPPRAPLSAWVASFAEDGRDDRSIEAALADSPPCS
ncbi:MAG: glycosyltransferase family 2 protein [Luteimonas sp.]